jgi:hypothetical protein
MKKQIMLLSIILVMVLMVFAFAACDNGGYDKAVMRDGREEAIISYSELGSTVVVVTERGIYVSNKDEIENE